MCIPQEQKLAIANFMLVKSHEISKILVKSEQSLRAKSPGFTGLEISYPLSSIIVMDSTLLEY